MAWFTRNRGFLAAEQEAWQIETFAWLASHLGGAEWLAARPQVLPTRVFFPATESEGEAKVRFVFDCVRGLMGMLEWPCELVPQPERPHGAIPGMTYAAVHSNRAAGTFSLVGNSVEITYDPADTDKPWRLIATLAHELAHYRLAALPEPPPGAPQMLEPATDLTTIAFGFGVFGANTAFEFRGHQDFRGVGWSTSRLGYLREREWMFGLALMLDIGGRPSEPLRPYIKDHLWSDLAAARKYLRKRDGVLASLRATSAR